MKGTIVSAWMKSCKKLYSDTLVSRALEENGLPSNKLFTPLEDVDDALCNRLMATISQKAGVSLSEMWRDIGHENVGTFFELYSGFFRHASAYNFLKSMNDVHAIVMRRFQGAKPPVLDMEPISRHSAYFTYRSKRGMFDYFVGMLEGAALHYGETIRMQEVSRSEDEMKLKLTFEKPIERVRRFWPNRILSLGLLRHSSIKIALLNALGIGAMAYVMLGSWEQALPFVGLSFGITLVVSIIVSLPFATVKGEVRRLVKKDFSSTLNLYTADEYQSLNKDLNELKQGVQKDFIGFNAMVDEMNIFNKSLSAIGRRMNDTSDGISRITQELASGAYAQAEDTERSIGILNENLSSVARIAQEEQDNKQLLETAVGHIEGSFTEVRTTAERMRDVLVQFSHIRNHGNALKHQVNDITNIVSLVSQISQQTNLLALNASIEASHAGAAGKGFAVVADEVRALSHQTHDAVQSINGILTNFVDKIERLVDGVDVQYTVLEGESGSLSRAVQDTSRSNEQIRLVSEKLVITAEKLQAQTQQISTLFDTMQSLAAIAQENSAASDAASVSVRDYTEQIKELTGQIMIFDTLIQSFKDDLSRYTV